MGERVAEVEVVMVSINRSWLAWVEMAVVELERASATVADGGLLLLL